MSMVTTDVSALLQIWILFLFALMKKTVKIRNLYCIRKDKNRESEKCPICSGARVVEGINDLSILKPELVSEMTLPVC